MSVLSVSRLPVAQYLDPLRYIHQASTFAQPRHDVQYREAKQVQVTLITRKKHSNNRCCITSTSNFRGC